MSEITTDREEAAKQLASDGMEVWRDLSPTRKDEWRRVAAKRIERDGGVRVHPSEDSTDAAAYVGVAMRGRLDDIARLVAIADDPDEATEAEVTAAELDHAAEFDDHELQSSVYRLQEAAQEALDVLPLCVETTTVFAIVLGTGGPDDRLIVECRREVSQGEPGGRGYGDVIWEIRRIVYRYSWSGSGEVELTGEDRATAETFARRVVPDLVE